MIAADDLSRMRILVVDDEPANVSLLQFILRKAGYKCVEVTTDPRASLALFKRFRPDLVLLDLMMPHVSGFEVMRALDAEIDPRDCLPILVLTADVTTASRHAALQAGASDFLTKPFDQTEVLLRIRHLLRIRAQHRQLIKQNGSLEEAVHARTGELTHALEQLGETVRQLCDTRQQVIQHERMSALGAMAAGLTHDFNNALSLILGYSEMLLNDLSETPYRVRADEYLGSVIIAAQDAAKMVHRLRGFYRVADQEQDFRPVQLNHLVEQAVSLTRPRWLNGNGATGPAIAVRTILMEGLPPLLGDAAELREMITNLIFNAIDAMPNGGTLTLRTRGETGADTDPEHAAKAPAPGTTPGIWQAGDETRRPGAVVLEVVDSGTGMDDETRRRCLEPFFTTKGGGGTGLGLAMVYGAMQRHRGSVDLQSIPGQGTTVTLRMPLTLPPDTPVHSPIAVEEQQRSWRILAVDDQAVFLGILQQFLVFDCHVVETALDGNEALEKFRARVDTPERFDLVITDQAMPHLTGLQLAAAVKALAPGTRVILLTGLLVRDEGGATGNPTVDLTLLKPVTQANLRAAIGRLMAGGPPRRPLRRGQQHPRDAGTIPNEDVGQPAARRPRKTATRARGLQRKKADGKRARV